MPYSERESEKERKKKKKRRKKGEREKRDRSEGLRAHIISNKSIASSPAAVNI